MYAQWLAKVCICCCRIRCVWICQNGRPESASGLKGVSAASPAPSKQRLSEVIGHLFFEALLWDVAQSNQLTYRDARASLGYSDRRFCCDGCTSTSVVCSPQQRRWWLACPPLDVALLLFPVWFPAACFAGRHCQTVKTSDAWLWRSTIRTKNTEKLY